MICLLDTSTIKRPWIREPGTVGLKHEAFTSKSLNTFPTTSWHLSFCPTSPFSLVHLLFSEVLTDLHACDLGVPALMVSSMLQVGRDRGQLLLDDCRRETRVQPHRSATRRLAPPRSLRVTWLPQRQSEKAIAEESATGKVNCQLIVSIDKYNSPRGCNIFSIVWLNK